MWEIKQLNILFSHFFHVQDTCPYDISNKQLAFYENKRASVQDFLCQRRNVIKPITNKILSKYETGNFCANISRIFQ